MLQLPAVERRHRAPIIAVGKSHFLSTDPFTLFFNDIIVYNTSMRCSFSIDVNFLVCRNKLEKRRERKKCGLMIY